MSYNMLQQPKENDEIQQYLKSSDENYKQEWLKSIKQTYNIHQKVKVLCKLGNVDIVDFNDIKGDDWVAIMLLQPVMFKQIFNHYDSLNKGWHWSKLLEKFPEYEQYCDWSLLTGNDWLAILMSNPQHQDKCNWSLIKSWEFAFILAKQPHHFDKCDWTLFSDYDLSIILKDQPQLSQYVTNWTIVEDSPYFIDMPDFSTQNLRKSA